MDQSGNEADVMDVITRRRAVRAYTPRKIDSDTVRKLLAAAVYAPTAFHEEPWAFAVIQDPAVLKRLSATAREAMTKEAATLPPEKAERLLKRFADPAFNVFYNAGTLIAIYGKPKGPFVMADCWLAAENLMLAASALGLGTCVIGLAIQALNAPEWKAELGIPADLTAIAPIIVGEADGETPRQSRKEPEILYWK
ncbi:MAG: nitroreductase family protein [Alphaproteobacteria bacterium]|nr:nitroreductase family protein [Alphaproteobacteria bacterium]